MGVVEGNGEAHLGVWNDHGTTQSPAFPGLLRSRRLQDLFQAHFDGANLPTPNAATGSAKRRKEFCDQQEPKQQATSNSFLDSLDSHLGILLKLLNLYAGSAPLALLLLLQ